MLKSYSVTEQTMQALKWFAANEPIARFDNLSPSHDIRAKLETRGLIRPIGDSYCLTKFGRMLVKRGTEL